FFIPCMLPNSSVYSFSLCSLVLSDAFIYFLRTIHRLPPPPPFAYTTLFRSSARSCRRGRSVHRGLVPLPPVRWPRRVGTVSPRTDRKSTRLNSSHVSRSYAVFCLKKKLKLSKNE